MKFDNEDAYRLTRDYMSSKAEKLSESSYFSRFIETYNKFDEWLKSDNPIESAKSSKKPFTIQNDVFSQGR